MNLTGKVNVISDKINNFPLTISGLLHDQCVTVIELPEMFDNIDILKTSDAIKKRCFDKSILYIDTRFEKPSKELLQILGSNLQLMELSYGQKFLKSLSIL